MVIVLGTGLGKLVDSIEDPIDAHYNHIPFFPLATVEFHTGKLVFGTISGSAVANVVGTGVITIPMIKKRGFSALTNLLFVDNLSLLQLLPLMPMILMQSFIKSVFNLITR